MSGIKPKPYFNAKLEEREDITICPNCHEPVLQYVTLEQMDRQLYNGEVFWIYCPHCGAKMYEGASE